MVKHVDRSRPPRSDDRFFQLVAINILERRMGWIENEMARASKDTRARWDIVKKMLVIDQKTNSTMPEMDFPKPEAICLDDEITHDYLSRVVEIYPKEDWVLTWILCLEAFLFGVVTDEGDIGQFITLDGFLYHNALASNNTLQKLKQLLHQQSSPTEDMYM